MGRRRDGGSWFRAALGSSDNGHEEGPRRPRRWKRRLRSAFSASAWRRRLGVPLAILHMVSFRILYVVEALVLAVRLCFYFCRFGCRV